MTRCTSLSRPIKGTTVSYTHLDVYKRQSDYLEVDHRYLPSVEGEFMRLNYTFLDSDGIAVNH